MRCPLSDRVIHCVLRRRFFSKGVTCLVWFVLLYMDMYLGIIYIYKYVHIDVLVWNICQ